MIMDLYKIKDKTGNWLGYDNNIQTAVQNIIRLNPNQLKFLNDGLGVHDFIASNYQYSTTSLLTWLKQQLINRGYPIDNIKGELLLSGEYKLNIQLLNHQSTEVLLTK